MAGLRGSVGGRPEAGAHQVLAGLLVLADCQQAAVTSREQRGEALVAVELSLNSGRRRFSAA